MAETVSHDRRLDLVYLYVIYVQIYPDNRPIFLKTRFNY